MLIVVSDGGDNASKRDLVQIMTMAGESDAIIYTLGLFDRNDPDRNPACSGSSRGPTGASLFSRGNCGTLSPSPNKSLEIFATSTPSPIHQRTGNKMGPIEHPSEGRESST